MESVILENPLTLILFGISLFFCLFDRKYRGTKGFFSILSCILALLSTAYSLTIGASLWECAAILLVFLLLNLEEEHEL